MATKRFFVNKASGKKFEVIGFDKEKDEIILKGEYAQFTEPFSKERFTALGYWPSVEEVPDEEEEAAVEDVPTVEAVLRAFADALRRNVPMPVTGLDGQRAVEIAEACYRSVETGQPVRL